MALDECLHCIKELTLGNSFVFGSVSRFEELFHFLKGGTLSAGLVLFEEFAAEIIGLPIVEVTVLILVELLKGLQDIFSKFLNF